MPATIQQNRPSAGALTPTKLTTGHWGSAHTHSMVMPAAESTGAAEMWALHHFHPSDLIELIWLAESKWLPEPSCKEGEWFLAF